jgi:hypothetical protein
MTCARKAECPVCKRMGCVTLAGKMHSHGKPRCAGSRKAVPPTLRERLIDVVLRLSVHPAGMTDWRWYERLCLECADEVDECVMIIERKPNAANQPCSEA